MDKELLRIAIIATGVVVILGMLLWSFIKNKKSRREINFVDKGNPLDNIDKSLIINTDNDDFEIVSLGAATDDEFEPDPISLASENTPELEEVEPEQPLPVQLQQSEPEKAVPSLIQFSIVARTEDGFNGQVLVDKLAQVGLEYGSMKVFERVDEQRRVDYAVASMVEPGTFPDTDLEQFNSPGIVFFIQPRELDEPLAIFDDYIQTLNWLAKELGGNMLDQKRQPLTDDAVQEFRALLS